MSIAKHHAEWLSLIEVSGPFLSLNALSRVFPQGLDTVEPARAAELRAAYEEWLDESRDLRFQRAWVLYVLKTLLDWDESVLAEGQAIPEPMQYAAIEHGGETVRPDFVLHERRQANVARALVSVYPREQDLEKAIPKRAWPASPATRMLALLHATGARLGLVTNGEQWLLVNASSSGVAGYISWYAELWNEERLTLRAFVSLLTLRRFFGVADEDTLTAMLDESANDAQEVTDQLGLQVRRAVEILVRSLDRADQAADGVLLDGIGESKLYEAALTVMMRLVFLLSAEERGLFLLGDPIYDQNYAVSTLRAQLHESADRSTEDVLEHRYDAWSRLLATFRLVYFGSAHEDLKLPAYGGSLFDPDRFPFLEGRSIGAPPAVDNRTVLHLLDALQILQTGGEARRLSFRALDIEQIGHVYEGLLDHEARRAGEVVLGFNGSLEPEIALTGLEQQADVQKYLKEQTGRSSVSTIKNALAKQPDPERLRRLLSACRGDAALFERVQPYLNLLRDDEFDHPVVVHPGSVYVTAGSERRATGTHYTPRSLTEPIVEHTLEPQVYRGVADGLPPVQERLKSPRELLALKVCDMAMGSGAFLVAACRYLATKLLEAWQIALDAAPMEQGAVIPKLTIDGAAPTGALGEILIPNISNDPKDPDNLDERRTLALRLVADRCLYGVDKNPLAVEMAKLSLWLVTLAKGRPFTFLDHALRHGDSLVGVSLTQLRDWTLDLSAEHREVPIVANLIRFQIEDVIKLRQQIESFPVNSIADQREKQRLLSEAEAHTHNLREAGNLLLATVFNDYNARDREAMRKHLLDVVQKQVNEPEEYYGPIAAVKNLPPFHWELEFPEVFLGERGGFDAFVGNPPFLGGSRISTIFGDQYFLYLQGAFPTFQDRADICSIFLLNAFEHVRHEGGLGLITTNTISQADTRQAGLDRVIECRGQIYRATSSLIWPGTAAVVVGVIHIFKGTYRGSLYLNEQHVERITAFLDDLQNDGKPRILPSNLGKSYRGSVVVGIGFTLSEEEAIALIAANARNSEVIFPYLNGQDVNSSPTQSASRQIINFFDWPLERASQFPEIIGLVRERVKPSRDTVKRDVYREYWWQYAEKQKSLYEAIKDLPRVIVRARITRTHAPVFVSTGFVFSDALIVIPYRDAGRFAVLQSSFNEKWAWQYGSTLKLDLRYSPTDVLENFAFPEDRAIAYLEPIGETYHETRRQIMLARQEGLTATYNRFHNPAETSADIQSLRDLHRQMDEAVAAAYGWAELSLDHGFHETAQGVRYTISEAARREVLKRLLALNFERYEEEQRLGAGVNLGKGRRGRKPAVDLAAPPDSDAPDPNAPPPDQLTLFDDGSPKQSRLL